MKLISCILAEKVFDNERKTLDILNAPLCDLRHGSLPVIIPPLTLLAIWKLEQDEQRAQTFSIRLLDPNGQDMGNPMTRPILFTQTYRHFNARIELPSFEFTQWGDYKFIFTSNGIHFDGWVLSIGKNL